MWFDKKICEVCKAKNDMIEFLKQELTRKNKEWADERAEYKRAIDALLIKNQQVPIGQGVVTPPKVDLNSLNIWEDLTEKERAEKREQVKA